MPLVRPPISNQTPRFFSHAFHSFFTCSPLPDSTNGRSVVQLKCLFGILYHRLFFPSLSPIKSFLKFLFKSHRNLIQQATFQGRLFSGTNVPFHTLAQRNNCKMYPFNHKKPSLHLLHPSISTIRSLHEATLHFLDGTWTTTGR